MNDIRDLKLTVINDREYEVGRETAIKWWAGEIVVPKGYVTNLASIPRPFWGILPRNGKYGCASVAHDYLFDTHGLNFEYDISETNLIFKRIMEYDGVKPWKVWVMYNAVEMANKDYPGLCQ